MQPPICYNCKHRQISTAGPFFCDAFPDGIPGEIINNVADHREAFPGDDGIRFDPIDPALPLPEFGGANSDDLTIIEG